MLALATVEALNRTTQIVENTEAMLFGIMQFTGNFKNT
jgi:hypothetical protein